jgi:hypothetical protein
MCHGCLFVEMDSDSVDVDGCLKAEIIEELCSEFSGKQDALKVLDEEEKLLESEKECFQGLAEPKHPEWCPLQYSDADYYKAREKAVKEYESRLRQKIREVIDHAKNKAANNL